MKKSIKNDAIFVLNPCCFTEKRKYVNFTISEYYSKIEIGEDEIDYIIDKGKRDTCNTIQFIVNMDRIQYVMENNYSVVLLDKEFTKFVGIPLKKFSKKEIESHSFFEKNNPNITKKYNI